MDEERHAPQYEWDQEKAAKNLEYHGVSFDEARTVFDDPFFLAFPDPVHSFEESRYLIVGNSDQRHLLLVVYTERPPAIRLISARETTRRERKVYEEEKYSQNG